MRELLSDETWRRLDPSAGALTGRDRWRVTLAVAVAALVLVGGFAVGKSGLVVPRVVTSGSGGYGYDDATWHVYRRFDLRNHGSFPVEVVGVGRDGPGLEQVPYSTEVAGEDGVNELGPLAPGAEMWVGVAYRVTDCDAVPDGPWPVPVRVARPWGTQIVWVPLSPLERGLFDLPPVGDTGDPWQEELEWQRLLADTACYYRAGGEPWEPDG